MIRHVLDPPASAQHDIERCPEPSLALRSGQRGEELCGQLDGHRALIGEGAVHSVKTSAMLGFPRRESVAPRADAVVGG
jgi:hypothetical protein